MSDQPMQSDDPRRTHPQRNILYNVIGREPLQVDTAHRRLGSQSHLLLCSDGLWEVVEDHEMKSIVNAAENAQAACDELVALANARGGKDNISVIVVKMP